MSLTDIVFPLHIASLIFSAGGILLADHQAFNWFLGKTLTLDKKIILGYHRIVLTGLSLMIITGSILFWPMREYLLSNLVFIGKMFFVAVLVVNSFFIGKLMNIAVEIPYSVVLGKKRLFLILSGTFSTIGWLGAFISALFLF